MEQTLTTSRIESQAPALSRGLAILQMLAQHPESSLEWITTELQLPKASVYRLLGTLEEMGMVHRAPDKRYSALWQLRPVHSPLESFRTALEAQLPQLAIDSQCTAEWYEPTDDGMQLVLQQNPDREVSLQARPGYLRDWKTELEAVTRLAHAFADQAPALSKSQHYVSNGKLESVTKAQIQKGIQAAKAARSAYDNAFNSNGVRRVAIAVFAPGSHSFLGILALAEVYHFSQQADPQHLIQLLRSSIKRS